MATYKANIDTVSESIVYTVGERHIYGSDRVGMYTYPDTVYPVPAVSTANFQPVWRGYRKYELKNHLGNVTTVVNANKIPLDANTDGIIDGFNAIIEGAYDYSPFGVTRKSFEPNYTAGSSGEVNPLAPDFRWCFDGDGLEANGSGHDATLYSMSTTADRNSQAGNALESQGNANSYMEIQHDADLVFGGNDFTVGIWVKRLALNSNWNHTIAAGKWHSGQQASQNEWYLAISNGGSGNNPPQFAIQAGSTKYTAAGTALPVGSWYHLVGVREGDYIKLYVDGTLVDTKYVGAAVVNTVPSRNILLGLMGNGKFLKARYDEFVIYHRALNETEVNELYGMGCGDFEGEEGELASGGYRYGFQGQEKDDEVKGGGNSYDFGARMLDPRIGRWFAVDPLAAKYPAFSPYSFVANSPLLFIDPDGRKIVVHYEKDGKSKKVVIKKMSDIETLKSIDNGFVQDVYESLQYLKEEQPITDAITTKKKLNLMQVGDGEQVGFYEDGGFFIDYNPTEALEVVQDSEFDKSPNDRIGSGKIQTPALGLLHEVGHFLGRIAGSKKDHQDRRDEEPEKREMRNAEEERVITKVENPAAERLGEPKRTNHSGIPRKSKGPTSTDVEPRKKNAARDTRKL